MGIISSGQGDSHTLPWRERVEQYVVGGWGRRMVIHQSKANISRIPSFPLRREGWMSYTLPRRRFTDLWLKRGWGPRRIQTRPKIDESSSHGQNHLRQQTVDKATIEITLHFRGRIISFFRGTQRAKEKIGDQERIRGMQPIELMTRCANWANLCQGLYSIRI